MKLVNCFSLLVSVVALCYVGTSHANQDNAASITDEIKQCAIIEDKDMRISCYDALAQSVLGSESAESSTSESVAQNQSEPTDQKDGLPDRLGGGIFAENAGVKAEKYRGKVKSCKKSLDRKWFYIFENGQVWKQVDSRKRRHKECDFWVTIVEDSFGYKMIIDGQDGKIRIDRRR
jgi:hypothetical protein